MRAGMPRVTLDVSHVEALLDRLTGAELDLVAGDAERESLADRLSGAERECNRLAAECLTIYGAARRECAEYLRASIGGVVSAGRVVENSAVRQRLSQLADQMAVGTILDDAAMRTYQPMIERRAKKWPTKCAWCAAPATRHVDLPAFWTMENRAVADVPACDEHPLWKRCP